MQTVLDDEVTKKLEDLVQRICDQYSACLFVEKYLVQLEKTHGITGDSMIDTATREARRKLFAPMHAELDKVLGKGPLFTEPERAATPLQRETEEPTKTETKTKRRNTR